MSGVLATLRTLPTGQRSKGGSIKRLLCVVAGVVLAATVVAGTTKTITGTRKAEVMMVTQGADVINALAGNDKLRGLGGNDTLNGGPGQDVLSGGAGDDVLNGGARKDVMTGGAGKDRYLCTAGDVVHADIADTIPPACTNVIGLPAPAQASVVDASAPEGDTGTKVLSFPVTLAAASPYVVTISFATADGTATAGSDYVAANGSLTFNPGETSKTVDVTINADTTVEADETFTVTLSGPNHATLTKSSATGTIGNDDRQKPLAGHYAGSTSQGFDISFDVAGDVKSISNLSLTVDADCGGFAVEFTGNWGQPVAVNQNDWSFSDALDARRQGERLRPGRAGAAVRRCHLPERCGAVHRDALVTTTSPTTAGETRGAA
jgi:hypothetical protein